MQAKTVTHWCTVSADVRSYRVHRPILGCIECSTSHRSVRDLTGAIRTYIDSWNDRAHPSSWTKNAEDILAKAKRPETSNTGH